MQLNIYVPKEKEGVVQALDEAAKRTGKQKDELVLELLEAYLAKEPPQWEVFDLGLIKMPARDEIYMERWDSD